MDFFISYVYKVICGQPEPNTKEMQEMTDERVRVCTHFSKRACPELKHLHNATNVTQINSVPLHSRCCSTKKVLNSMNGVQLVMDDVHICVHSDIAVKWYHYFRVRHFPRFMCGLIVQWLKEQPWYIPHEQVSSSRLLNSHWVNTYKRLYKESIQILMT